MKHPSLEKKTAILINIILIFILTFGILIKTASINKPDIKKNIPMPKEEKVSLIGDINTQKNIFEVHSYIVDVASKERIQNKNN